MMSSLGAAGVTGRWSERVAAHLVRRLGVAAADARRCSPDGVDPSGLVKGWAVDRAAAILDRGEAGRREHAAVGEDRERLVAVGLCRPGEGALYVHGEAGGRRGGGRGA